MGWYRCKLCEIARRTEQRARPTTVNFDKIENLFSHILRVSYPDHEDFKNKLGLSASDYKKGLKTLREFIETEKSAWYWEPQR